MILQSASPPRLDQEIQWLCPKCGIECPDTDTLNIHVQDCLDQP